MRDISLLTATLCQIRDNGAGFARRVQASPHGFVWYAGAVRLNGQAVADLIGDGWLSPSDGTDHTTSSPFPFGAP